MRIHAPVLIYFDAVHRAGSIREAARRLNVASSAVNRQIIKLEEEVGAPLFDRFANGIKLTSAGEAFARHVMVVLQDLERARTDIQNLQGARTGHVTVAAVEGVCANLLPDVIAHMKVKSSRVTVTADAMGSQAVQRAVQQGDADVGIAFALLRHRELRQVSVARFRLGAIMAPAHPLSGRTKVNLATCFDYPVLLASGDLSISQLLKPAMVRMTRTIPPPSVCSSSIHLLRELAERNLGIAFQTLVGIEDHIKQGRLVHVPVDAGGPIWADLGVYVRSERALPATVDLFIQFLTEELSCREALEASMTTDAESASGRA